MNKAQVRKKATVRGLQREVRILKAKVVGQRVRADNNREIFLDAGKDRDKALAELSAAKDRFSNVMMENAELHGYINRVEIRDDARWYARHGNQTHTPPADGQGYYDAPPLRQRLRGAAFVSERPRDILSGGDVMGKGPRTRFAG